MAVGIRAFIKDVFSTSETAPFPQPVGVSPDRMIAGAVIQSFISNTIDWKIDTSEANNVSAFDSKLFESSHPVWSSNLTSGAIKLVNAKDGITVKFNNWHQHLRSSGKQANRVTGKNCYINGVRISDSDGIAILCNWLTYASKLRAAEEAAAKAKAEMQANEAKWNLVEDLLKMKRTRSGRLIALSSYCPRCDEQEPEKDARHNETCPKYRKPAARRPKPVNPFPTKETEVAYDPGEVDCAFLGSDGSSGRADGEEL
jgi:hypothetical protein